MGFNSGFKGLNLHSVRDVRGRNEEEEKNLSEPLKESRSYKTKWKLITGRNCEITIRQHENEAFFVVAG